MEFIGRDNEMKILNKEFERESSFVLITGRRRIGKTRLIKEFISDKDAIYFLTSNQTENLILKDFSNSLSLYSGRTYGEFNTWENAFKALTECSNGKKILVIDEFQYLCNDKSFPLKLQVLWDELLSKHDIMLIISGSHISMMESLGNDKDGPLYGRFTRKIILGPLPFDDVRHNKRYTDDVEEYAVLGGVPRYMELFDDIDLRDNILENVMDPSALMFDDPKILLGGEVKEPVNYMSIMRAVASGNRKLTSISSAIQVSATTLSTYLKKLIEIRMLVKTVPVTENDPESSKSGLYSVYDNYAAFWFRFVYPYSSELSMGNTKWAISEFDEHFIEDHVSFVFESICRDMVRNMGDAIGFDPVRVGSFWTKEIEIDVMAINSSKKKAFVAECKYRKNAAVSYHVLNELKKKCAGIKALNDYDITYGLFSVSGFDDRILQDKTVVLVNNGIIIDPKEAHGTESDRIGHISR
jgi:uncharacterized protein